MDIDHVVGLLDKVSENSEEILGCLKLLVARIEVLETEVELLRQNQSKAP